MVQELRVMDSVPQEDREEVSQSSQLLVTTCPEESTWVAHHGLGESE